MKCAAPLSWWRTTNMSQYIASRLRSVSSRLSPLVVAAVARSRFSTSADRRLAASSKVVRVRVLASKNRLAMVLPRSSGTLRTAPEAMRNERATSRISSSSAAGRPSMVRKWRSRPAESSWQRAVGDSRNRRAWARFTAPAPAPAAPPRA